MAKLFVSHSSQDDGFVRELRAALADQGQPGWVDSRALRGGDPLWSAIRKAIENSSAVAVVVSPNGHGSPWVGKESRHALDVQQQRGRTSSRSLHSPSTAPNSALSKLCLARSRFSATG